MNHHSTRAVVGRSAWMEIVEWPDEICTKDMDLPAEFRATGFKLCKSTVESTHDLERHLKLSKQLPTSDLGINLRWADKRQCQRHWSHLQELAFTFFRIYYSCMFVKSGCVKFLANHHLFPVKSSDHRKCRMTL